MAPSQKQRLAEIKERESKATKGPWEYSRFRASLRQFEGELIGLLSDSCGSPTKQEDCDFIAHSRSDIPLLLTLLDQAQRDTERVETGDVTLSMDQRVCGVLIQALDDYSKSFGFIGAGEAGALWRREAADQLRAILKAELEALDQAALARGEGEK